MIYFDAHVHVYPFFSVERLLDSLLMRAAQRAAGATAALLLAERQGETTFAGWVGEAARGQGTEVGRRWRPVRHPDASCVVMSDGRREVWVFAGRQVAAAEAVEALGLFGSAPVPDGQPLARTLQALSEAGMLPVLAWGLGKWLFRRRQVVAERVAAAAPGSLLIGDSAMRPVFWPEPALMAAARRNGCRVLAGSDPLPRPGDEAVAGQYATCIDADIEPSQPSASLRRLLLDPAVPLMAVGRRHGLLATLRRMA